MNDDQTALWQEFKALAERAGITIPDDRIEVVFASFLELRRQAALVHEDRPAASEPASIYDIAAVLRAARS